MKKITAYACSYCGKIYKNKSSAASHEKKCFANPARRACRTCKHAIKDTETAYVRLQGDQITKREKDCFKEGEKCEK